MNFGPAAEKSLRGLEMFFIYLVITRLHIQDQELPPMLSYYFVTDLTSVLRLSPSRDLLPMAGNLLTGSVPPSRADAQEANQQGYDVPEEPEWLRQAPGADRYTA